MSACQIALLTVMNLTFAMYMLRCGWLDQRWNSLPEWRRRQPATLATAIIKTGVNNVSVFHLSPHVSILQLHFCCEAITEKTWNIKTIHVPVITLTANIVLSVNGTVNICHHKHKLTGTKTKYKTWSSSNYCWKEHASRHNISPHQVE